jgi:outer membrane protein OmpA-like peptidoglycan-associated protein/tetratricopeptide (TPR) repeat protein
MLMGIPVDFSAQSEAFYEDDPCHQILNGRIVKLLEKGKNGSKYERSERIAFLQEGYDREENCMECLYEWGRLEFNEIKRSRGSFRSAEEPLLQLLGICPFYNADAKYMLGAMAYADGRYAEALEYFKTFLEFPSESESALGKRYEQHVDEVIQVLPAIDFLLSFWKNQNAFTPSPIPPISESADEYLPALSPDGTLLFFTRKGAFKAKGDVVSREVETFMLSERTSGKPFQKGLALEYPFKEGLNYGGVSISVDNLDLYIAAQNPVAGHPNNIDLFLARYEVLDRNDDGSYIYFWGDLKPLESLNTEDGWEAQPALSADGQELFFSAVNAQSITDASGNATMDIWVSKRDTVGAWGVPELLPAPINTTTNDKSPFLHPDGNTLYFASDRQPGGGGYDLWVCRRDSTGAWGKAQNLGSPVNTDGDEHGLVVSADGTEAMFASRRIGTKGLDILKFPMPEEFKPDPVFVVKGTVSNAEGNIPDGAKLYLQYAQSRNVEEVKINREDGRFASVVKMGAGEDVLLIAEAEGIAFEAQVLYDHESSFIPDNNQVTSIELEAAENGQGFEIGDIQFKSNSSSINRTSLLMLEQFSAYLLRNEAIGVHVIGHTDDRGDREENQELSRRRAESVANAIQSNGVQASRISFEGKGQSAPIESNQTKEGRSRNRRTEFQIRLD